MKGGEPKKSGKDGKQQKFKPSAKSIVEPPSFGNHKSVTKEDKYLE